jgi:aminopeptidase-like protein
MANNELSGPCLAIALADWLQQQEALQYSYRFVFIPEIIGSAAFLESKRKHLQEKVIAGFNLTCVGDNRTWSFLPSRLGGTYADQIALHTLKYNVKEYDNYSWNDRGSDESMYCAPSIDLPMVLVMRSKFGTYPEYHTSLDTIGKVVTAEGLQGSLDLHKKMINIVENNCIPKSQVLGEPQLGPRGLYPMISKKGSTVSVKNRLNLISYADGEHTLLEIAEKCGVAFEELIPEIELLRKHGILKTKPLNKIF